MNKLFVISCFLFLGLESYAQGDWQKKANMPAVARHRTVAFTVGNKGYMGLGHYNSGPNGNIYLNDIWEYDPSTNTWTQKADFGGGHRYHAVGIGYKNVAFVGTGRDQTNPPNQAFTLETDWWKFDPVANSWTLMTPIPGPGRRGAVAFLVDSLIFVGTGQISGGYTNDFYAYDAENDQWYGGIAPLPGGGRTSAVAFSIDGKGYAGTGGIGCGSNDFYEYKMSTNQWLPRSDIGGPIRNEACGFAVNGKGFILTGDNCSSGTNYKDVWEYDPDTDTWTELEEFPGSARRYMNAFVIGSKVYVGSGTSGVNYNDLWEYDQALAELKKNEDLVAVSTYPNPAIDQISFKITDLPQSIAHNEIELKIYSITGTLAYQNRFANSSLTVTSGELQSGMYLFTLSYENFEFKKGKIQIL